MSNKTNRSYTSAQKVAILKSYLVDKISGSEICKKVGIQPSLFYRWQQELFLNAEQIFNGKQKNTQINQKEKTIQQLQSKLHQKNELLADLMEEHIALKKSIAGES